MTIVFFLFCFGLCASDTFQSNFLDNSTSLKEASREALVTLIENYKRILPKIMGCGFCQFFHKLLDSECFEHFKIRQTELQKLGAIIGDQNFNPKDALNYLDEMMAFEGAFGKDFHAQCQKLLLLLVN